MNPSNETHLAHFQEGSADDVDAAVHAARQAFETGPWSRMAPRERGNLLLKLADLVEKNKERLAILESMDNGKPIRETRDVDVPLVARHFYHHAGWAQLADTEFAGYGPVGVVGQIIPWNFPLLMLSWKVAPALAAGNTVVLKPAEYTSLTALLFAEFAHQAGLPAGVLNVITGDGLTSIEKIPSIARTSSWTTRLNFGLIFSSASEDRKTMPLIIVILTFCNGVFR
jgi:aldehyde dehydrogenase (NAD+)